MKEIDDFTLKCLLQYLYSKRIFSLGWYNVYNIEWTLVEYEQFDNYYICLLNYSDLGVDLVKNITVTNEMLLQYKTDIRDFKIKNILIE